MSFYQPSGQNNASEYLASGLPFVTASSTGSEVTVVEFPFVTKFFLVKNTGSSSMGFGFTENGILSGENTFSLEPSQSFQGDIRIKDLFLHSGGGSNTFEVIAGLTGIARKNFPVLTGSLNVFSGSAQSEHGFNSLGYPGIG